MKIKHIIRFLSILLLQTQSMAQSQPYDVELLPLSSKTSNDFAPFVQGNTLYFCSDKKLHTFISYQSISSTRPSNIFTVEIPDSGEWAKEKAIDPTLISVYNDGPLSISQNDSILVYSSNINQGIKLKNNTEKPNRLGLFFSYKQKGKWTKPVAFRYNSTDYSLSTPAINQKGDILVFSSNMAGGLGASDLYVSYRNGDQWSQPENLGSEINTAQSDAYPYISAFGDLFFASEGYKGPGGKDIVVAKFDGKTWHAPSLLSEPINSKADDFSFWTDTYFQEGYLASDRAGTDDIYKFVSRSYPFSNCIKQKKNNYCFQFYDDNASKLTTPYSKYKWIFSDSVVLEGKKVVHCFSQPGKHSVRMLLIDDETHNTFLAKRYYEFEIEEFEQPYIEAVQAAIKDEPVLMDAFSTNLNAFETDRFYWDTGDTSFYTSEKLEHAYTKPGTYNIELGLIGKDTAGLRQEHCVTKNIQIFENHKEMIAELEYEKLAKDMVENSFMPESDQSLYYLFAFNYSQIRDPHRDIVKHKLKRLNFTPVDIKQGFNDPDVRLAADTLVSILKRYDNVNYKILIYHNNSDVSLIEKDIEALKTWLDKIGLDSTKLEIEQTSYVFPLKELIKNYEGQDFNRLEFVLLPVKANKL